MRLNGKTLPPRVDQRSKELPRDPDCVPDGRRGAEPGAHGESILTRPLRFYHGVRGAGAPGPDLLDMVRLSPQLAGRYPGELSGGQKQRVNLARALAAEPSLILCDEVTSALDTVVAAAVLELLAELRRELGVAMMFISHDLSTVRAICDQVWYCMPAPAWRLHRKRRWSAPPGIPIRSCCWNRFRNCGQTGWMASARGRQMARQPGWRYKIYRLHARSSGVARCTSPDAVMWTPLHYSR